ncbi:hypothetical protein EGM51_17595 [Verrucomicrobia bacterium S94]|nr:hypothetical protein EGM51_17595 [Verrucomicrobia bacterium S94]
MSLKYGILITAISLITIAEPCSAALVTDVFDYSGAGAPPGPVSATAEVLAGDLATGTLGEGWNTTVELPLGAIYTLSAAMPGDGNFTISGTGAAGLAGEVTARRVFSGPTLLAGETYSFSLSTENEALVGLLGSIQVEIGVTDGITDTVLASTATGTGLLGIIDFLTLFGSSKTATFNFDGLDTSGGDLYVELQTETLASMLGETVQFNNMDISQVPEPVTLVLISFFGCGILVCRRFFLN